MAVSDMSVHSVDTEYRNFINIVSPSLEVRGRYPIPVAYMAVPYFGITETGNAYIIMK